MKSFNHLRKMHPHTNLLISEIISVYEEKHLPFCDFSGGVRDRDDAHARGRGYARTLR